MLYKVAYLQAGYHLYPLLKYFSTICQITCYILNCLIDKSNIVVLFSVSNSTFLGIYHKPLRNFLEEFFIYTGYIFI